MNVTNQNQSLVKNEFKPLYFIFLMIFKRTMAGQGKSVRKHEPDHEKGYHQPKVDRHTQVRIGD